MIDLSSFILSNHTPSILTDSAWKIHVVNLPFEKLYGKSLEKIKGQSLTDYFPSLANLEQKADFLDSIESGMVMNSKIKGRKETCRIQVNRMQAEEKIFFWFTVKPNVEDGPSKDNVAFYKKIIQNSRDVIAYFDDQFKCTFISSSCEDLLGYTPDEFYKNKIHDLLHEDDRERFRKKHGEAIKSGQVKTEIKARLKKKDGDYIWVVGKHHREFDNNGNFLGLILNLAPYQSEIETENRLEHESEKFRLLTESISDIVTWLDSKGNVLYQSPSLKEALGYDPKAFKNINEVNELIHPDDLRNYKAVRQRHTRQKDEQYTLTYRIRDIHGQYHYFESHIRNLFSKNGKIRNIVFTSRDVSARFEREQELRESQFLYQYLTDHSNDVILRLDETNHITYISPSSHQLLGYQEKEIVKDDFFQRCIHPDDIENFNREWKVSLRKREDFMVSKMRVVHKDGHTVWIEFLIRREFDSKGLLRQSIANLRDISDRIADQLEVEKIKERYQLAVEAGHTGIWDYSFEDDKLIIDDSLKNLLGYGFNDEMDDDYFWSRLLVKDDSNRLQRTIDQFVIAGKTYFEETVRMVHRRNVIMWVLCRGQIFYKKNKPQRIICSVTDITDRIEANEKLRKALINFKAIFDAFPDLFFRVNRLGDFLEIMAGDSATFGISNPREMEGKNLKDAFPESEFYQLYESLQRAFDSYTVENSEYSLTIDGKIKHYEARIIAISSDEAIGIVRDSTETVKVNKEMIKARQIAEEALNAKDEFLSMMSHEIRTPLNVVIGMIYLLMEQDPRPDQLKLINTLKFSSDNLLSLINDLLDFSKIRAGKVVFEKTAFGLHEFIRNIHESYKLQLDRTKVDLQLDIDKKIPAFVVGDYNRLAQILNNLLSNAQKFTEEGHIAIRVKLKEENDGIALIEFVISDTGIGISKEKLSSIFEPFSQGEEDTTRKYGGTGLGLTIVKQLIELQGGTIGVKSKYGKGSEFSVMLPLPISKKAVVEEASAADKKSHRPRIANIRMLFADDVNSNRFLMKGYSDLWNFDLDLAADGFETMDLFNQNTYDVILLDLQMPGKDGFETASEIREVEKSIGVHTPILAVTGDISEETISGIFDSGMDDYLLKPVNPRIMIEKISDLLAGDTMENEPEEPEEESESSESRISTQLIDFKQVDYLYSGAPDQYSEYILMLIKELKENREFIAEAIRTVNFDEFRRVRHSMKSGLKLLNITELEKLLDAIKEDFIKNEIQESGHNFIERVDGLISKVIDKLDEKLKVLASPG